LWDEDFPRNAGRSLQKQNTSTMNITTDQRLMLIRALDGYESHLEYESMSSDPDASEWAKTEYQEVVEMRGQLNLQSE